MNYPGGFPVQIYGWKGKPFFQIVASIQHNVKNARTLGITQLMKPLPLTIYRKEIVNNGNPPSNCNSRVSVKVFDFETPGNNLVSRTLNEVPYQNGLVNIVDINPTTLSAENGACNNSSECFLSPQQNARRRCRSAGMIPRKFNVNRNNDCYATDTKQYLTSRNRTIKQNEYNYIRKGSSGIIPGPGLAASNIYSPGGLSHCYQPQISAANNNNVFQYVWADQVQYTITIPDGQYDVDGLNKVFQTAQIQNKTYLVGPGSSKVFLLNISYDTNSGSVVLYSDVISRTKCTANGYTAPALAGWSISGFPLNDPVPGFPTPPYLSGATYFILSSLSDFTNLIGFAAGIYFGGISESAFTPQIKPNYVTLYYKPNNPEFGVQGAVDASTRLQRLKYETITTGAGGIRSAYGDAAASALSYGVSEQAYTEKTQVGDKRICTPVIDPNSGHLTPKIHIYRL